MFTLCSGLYEKLTSTRKFKSPQYGGVSPPRGCDTKKMFTVTSEEFMETEKLPERIIFVGGGYISLEFSHIARRAGSEATILHRSERLLRHFDADMVNLLIKASEAAGIKILTNNPVTAVEKEGAGFLVRTEFESETQNFNADMVVHGADRVPDIGELNLEKARVIIEKGAIEVDKHMKTSNPRIYAGGDSASEGVQLTPVAALQGEVAAANVLVEDSVEIDYTGIPGQKQLVHSSESRNGVCGFKSNY